MLAQVVPKDKLQNAITWNTSILLSASITGHAMGGFLIAGLGNTGTLTVVVIMVVSAFIICTTLKRIQPLNERGGEKNLGQCKRGTVFCIPDRKKLLGAVSLDLFAVLFGGATALIPVYARDMLKVGAQGFGLLNGASDMGSICIVILLTIFPPRRKTGRETFIRCCRIRDMHNHIRSLKIILALI